MERVSDQAAAREAADADATGVVEAAGVGGAALARGTGLVGLKDRVEALGGRIVLYSPPGAGTTLRAELPLTAANDGVGPSAG